MSRPESRAVSPGRRSFLFSGPSTPKTANTPGGLRRTGSRDDAGGARPASARPSSAAPRLSLRSKTLPTPGKPDASLDGRVRVAVRLRPVLPHEEALVVDTAPIIEVEPEVQRVAVKRSHWDADQYQFDQSFPGPTSQKRLYEEFCAPVVDSCIRGYNGTVMAYGQTGTGKTHTLGNLGLEDASARGIVMRAMDHVLTHALTDKEGEYKLTLSYVQLYMETVLDLLEPEREGLNISEDPSTGEVVIAGARVVEVTNLQGLVEILEVGESNRVVANQRLNATSSRSHSILIINIRRLPKQKAGGSLTMDSVTATKGKLLLVDLAGSERISKSGSEGQMLEEAKFINLSLTALGKCINCLAEGTAHVPYRDSKLTRLMKDSFGGTARTSLIVCVSPLRDHVSETTSALQFGQRAMTITNSTRIREEVDVKLLNYRMQAELDRTNEMYERETDLRRAAEQKALDDGRARAAAEQARDAAVAALAAEKSVQESIKERFRQQLHEMDQKLRAEWAADREAAVAAEAAKTAAVQAQYKELEAAQAAQRESLGKQTEAAAILGEQLKADGAKHQAEKAALERRLARAEENVTELTASARASASQKEAAHASLLAEARAEITGLQERAVHAQAAHDAAVAAERENAAAALAETAQLRRALDDAQAKLRQTTAQAKADVAAAAASTASGGAGNGGGGGDGKHGVWNQHRDAVSAVSKLFEHVGLTTVFGLLKYDDRDVRLHAVKVIANLAAEEENQVNIVAEGGLEALFELLQTCEDEMTLRVAAGAIANLAMSEANQHRIVAEGGLDLLVHLARTAQDPQTQRMIAGAIANLCGNANILEKLVASGSLQVLVDMSYSEHVDVLSQVARGFANNSKCTKGKTHLVELGAMPAILHLAAKRSLTTVRKHAMLALCQIASCAANVNAVRSSGALAMLTEIANSQYDEFKQMSHTVVSNPIYA